MVLVLITIWSYTHFLRKNDDIVVVTPLPDFLSRLSNNQVSTLELFAPQFESAQASMQTPVINAEGVLVYDLSTQKVVFEKNSKKRLPMASLTKIMTAIIALENPKEDDRYVVPAEALVGENSMGLTTGEVLSLEELLYGLILPSGNDAAEVFAASYPGGRAAFVRAMNNKAKALGLTDTNFTNPSGLQGDGDQYTTASDLLVITNYAIQHFPLFTQVTSTYEHSIPYTLSHKAFYLLNDTNLITSYPGVKGVKTGFTPEAGLCLVTYLDYKGHKVIGILLGSNNRRQEMKDLLDYALSSQGITPPRHQ